MRYREVGLIAEGGMALIAQAERDDGSVVVVKRVRPPFCFDPVFLRLFADEGAVHAALDHENIVHLLDKGEDEAGPYLVFEHVDGTDLAAVLEDAWASGTPLDVECVLAVAVPLFRALAFVHECPLSVVHRDVSPGNILIGNDGAVKLVDFGVASFSLKTEATVAGEMKGKFAYMAPEQTRGEKAGPRADLFAAGVVLWECLAGKRLFDGPTDADVVAAVRETPAPPLSGAPPALAALVASLLEKDARDRPESARAVGKALADIALELGFDEGLSRHAARLARMAPRRELQVRDEGRRRTQRVLGADGAAMVVRRRRSPLPLWGAGLGVVVLAGVVGAWALRPPPLEEKVEALPSTSPAPPAPPGAVQAGVGLPAAAEKEAEKHAADKGAADAAEKHAAEKHAAETQAAMNNAAERDAAAHDAAAHDAAAHDVAAHDVAAAREARAATARRATAGHEASGARKGAAEVHARDPVVAAVAGFGKLTITSEPWARVTVDGKLASPETPLRAYTVAAGKHIVVLENPVFHLSKTVVVDVAPDGDVKKYVNLNP